MASSRITGDWLQSPAAGADLHDYPGQSLGLPPSGRGSAIGFGPRLLAFAVDGLLSWLVATLIVGGLRTGIWTTIVYVVEYGVLVALGGQSAGMRLTGIRVLPVGRDRIGWWVLPRTLLMALLLPVLFTDRDLRGLHDRASGTVVVRA